MATAVEAPAGSPMAEGPTSHTQNQAPRLSPYQLRILHGGINGNRVQHLRGMSHLEAWDVRRELIRVFGFGGFDIETLSLDLVAEHEKKQGDKSRWTVVYRAQVRLIIKDTNGRPIAHFDDGAAGDSVNQPSLGDAHDMGMKTAFSQALKRCVVNLGDQFGLSLYNNGSPEPVVLFSAAHPPQEWKQQPPPQPEPVDPPVQPEPGAVPDPEQAGPSDTYESSQAEPRDFLHEAHEAKDADAVRLIWQEAKVAAAAPEYLEQIAQVGRQKGTPAATQNGVDPLDQMMGQVQRYWDDPMELTKVVAEAGRRQLVHRPVEGPLGGRMPLRDLLTARIAELKAQAASAVEGAHADVHDRSAA